VETESFQHEDSNLREMQEDSTYHGHDAAGGLAWAVLAENWQAHGTLREVQAG
jgi:hypothetical protein